MNFLVYLTMFGWIPIVIYLFNRFPSQQAVVIGFLIAWLFLPQAEFPLSGLPDYTKISATCYGILIATLIYDRDRFRYFRFNWIDIPIVIWCLCPFFSSLYNDLGIYDGCSSTLSQTMVWGIPYFLGRVYLNSFQGLRNLAGGIFLGGLLYVPLCLLETRMSPQLHRFFYGYHAHSFAQTMRLGGFRPTVFMEHGLEVGMWMMTATLVGIWLWKTNCIKQVYGIPVIWLVLALMVTFILSRSLGAYLLLVIGIVALFAVWQFSSPIIILSLAVAIAVYLGQNTMTANHIATQVVAPMHSVFPEERVSSLQFRIDNEMILKEKAQEKIFFGWGGWGRNRVYDYNWQGDLVDISTTDSLWIIAFGVNGLVGLVSLFASFLIPIINFIRLYPSRIWLRQEIAPAAVLVVILMLYMFDCLVNAMINPIFILTCGGVAGLVVSKQGVGRKKATTQVGKTN